MTDNNKTKYLDMELMEKMCHKIAVAVFNTTEDPIALFHEHDIDRLDAALNLPKAGAGDQEFYPTLVKKAAILYYALNKNHPFKNGNKRISAASLIVFLYINDHWLFVENNELYEKTLYVAKSDRIEKDVIVDELEQWIGKNVVPFSKITRDFESREKY